MENRQHPQAPTAVDTPPSTSSADALPLLDNATFGVAARASRAEGGQRSSGDSFRKRDDVAFAVLAVAPSTPSATGSGLGDPR